DFFFIGLPMQKVLRSRAKRINIRAFFSPSILVFALGLMARAERFRVCLPIQPSAPCSTPGVSSIVLLAQVSFLWTYIRFANTEITQMNWPCQSDLLTEKKEGGRMKRIVIFAACVLALLPLETISQQRGTTRQPSSQIYTLKPTPKTVAW